MAFKLFTQAQARDFGMRIINGYRQSHNIPQVGAGVILPTTPKRVQNKLRQSDFRANHTRMMVWDNEDNTALLAPIKIKLANITTARKALNHVNSQITAVQKKIDYGILRGLPIADKIQQLADLNATKTIKESELNTAKAA